MDHWLGGRLSHCGKIMEPLVLHFADRDEYFRKAGRNATMEGTRGNASVACYNYDADHSLARVNGIHWQGRAATIANGRSAKALVKAMG